MLPNTVEARVLAPGLTPGRYELTLEGGRIDAIRPITSEPGAAQPTDDRLLLPGFLDGHTHLLGVGMADLKPNFQGVKRRAEVLEILAAWIESHPGDTPIIGEGWDQSAWDSKRPPTREEIDRVAGRRRVALRRVCGHVAVLGSAALEDLGTEWPDLDPESGLAYEELPLRLNRLWPPNDETLDEAIERGQARAISEGVVGIQEMGDRLTYRAFGRAVVRGALRIKVHHFFHSDGVDSVLGSGLTAGYGDDHLRVAGIKIFLDGSFGGRSAAVREAYPVDSPASSSEPDAASAPNFGIRIFTDEKLERLLESCFEAELPVAMHAIGDGAIDQAVAAVERLAKRSVLAPQPGPRLEHAEYLTPDLFERALAAGFRFSMQPNFTSLWQGPGELYEQILGAARTRVLNPYRTAYDAGVLSFGSDTMPIGPLLGIEGATQHPVGKQRLDLSEAIESYTAAPARSVVRPFGSSKIEVGAPADFVLLHAPGSRAAGADLLRDARVVETWIDGERLFHTTADSSK